MGFVQRLLESRGVVVKTNSRVSRFRAEGGKLAGVTTEANEQLPADAAVIGVGAEPNTEWLANSGFQIERGGVGLIRVRERKLTPEEALAAVAAACTTSSSAGTGA